MLERGIFLVDKTKERLLEELLEVQKMLEQRTEAQGHMIRKFQMLIANEGLYSQIIDFFPYPIAIFTPQYTLAMVNKAFAAQTNMRFADLERETVRILRYKTDDTQLASAVMQVFSGGTFFLEDLKNPFSMFSGVSKKSIPHPDGFKRAVVFPVPADNAKVTHGVIVFMP